MEEDEGAAAAAAATAGGANRPDFGVDRISWIESLLHMVAIVRL